MQLFLVQHALAKLNSEDPNRGLTDNGITILRKTAIRAQKHFKIVPNRIFHSKKLRAKQTAEILAEYFSPKVGIIEEEGLAPLDNPEIWIKKLKDIQDTIMIVSHLPYLEKLCAILLNREELPIKFQNAGIIALEKIQDENMENHKEKMWKILFQIPPVSF